VELSLLLLLAPLAAPARAEQSSTQATRAVAATRPAIWAEAVAGSRVPNLYRVEPDLLRSAQPDSVGFQELAKLGVKTVLDLRAGHADAA
jgi:hypothetical protein